MTPPPGLEFVSVAEKVNEPPTKKGAEGLATMMQQLGTSSVRRIPASATMAEILMELVTVAAQLARIDSMLDGVRGCAPSECPEAAKWQQISTEALTWSRKSFAEQQVALVKQLATLTGATVDVGQSADDGVQLMKSVAQGEEDCSTAASTPDIASRVPHECEMPVSDSAAADADPASLDASSSLKLTLEKIKEQCPEKALIARKIKPLGFESPELLREHFTKYGPVRDVLVSHSITKPSPKRPNGRMRPAAMGFVIMETLEGAKKALAAGELQMISDTQIEVALFQEHCVE